MPDKLTEMYQDFQIKNKNATEFQAFQAGVTAGAVAMRERAMKAAREALDPSGDLNEVLNAIGSLSDIPQ